MLGKIGVQRVPTLIVESNSGPISLIVGNTAKVTLANGKSITGQLLNITEKTISILCSEYEYTDTGVLYSNKLLLIKDIIDIEKVEDTIKEISWKQYNSKISNWGS